MSRVGYRPWQYRQRMLCKAIFLLQTLNREPLIALGSHQVCVCVGAGGGLYFCVRSTHLREPPSEGRKKATSPGSESPGYLDTGTPAVGHYDKVIRALVAKTIPTKIGLQRKLGQSIQVVADTQLVGFLQAELGPRPPSSVGRGAARPPKGPPELPSRQEARPDGLGTASNSSGTSRCWGVRINEGF